MSTHTYRPRHADGIADGPDGPEYVGRHATPPFVTRVNRALSRYVGFRTTWEDLVGDWPEADYAEADDVDGAVEWILAEAGH